MPMNRPAPSFDLLGAAHALGKVPSYFDVVQFDVNVEQRYKRGRRARDRLDGGGEGQGRRREP